MKARKAANWPQTLLYGFDRILTSSVSETEEQQIERNSCHEINDEPTSEVMDSNFGWLADNLVILTDVSCPEID